MGRRDAWDAEGGNAGGYHDKQCYRQHDRPPDQIVGRGPSWRAGYLRAISMEDVMARPEGGAGRTSWPIPGTDCSSGGIYMLGGWAILGFLNSIGAPWMIIPLAIGFPCLALLSRSAFMKSAAGGMRANLSRAGACWLRVFASARTAARLDGLLSSCCIFFWMWVYQVRLLLALFLGFKSFSKLGSLYRISFCLRRKAGVSWRSARLSADFWRWCCFRPR